MKKLSSLKEKIWFYLIIFSCLILAGLWLFQITFLNTYYEWYKQRDLSKVVDKIVSNYDPDYLETYLEELSFDKGLCIEVTNETELVYSSNRFNRGCMIDKETGLDYYNYKTTFIESGETKSNYQMINPRFHNQTLVYALKLDTNTYAFVSASLQPLDATTKILTSQFIYVTIVVLLLSLFIGYIISKRLSKPIIKINNAAKKMAKGEYDVVFETGEDIRELNELADTLNYTRDELSNTEELRRELLANVSHDLKTPLTMMKAYAEMVRDLTYKDQQKREQNLNVIIEESDRLNGLVNDILELSKMQSNLVKLEEEAFDITTLIHTILQRYKILQDTEGYHFEFIAKKKLMVFADKKKIEQVIYNLINNAINYTGDDQCIQIKLKDQVDHIRVEITDTGAGIEENELDKIWDKYYKSDKKHKRNAYGTGIGLSIVKQILTLHDFVYGVESKIGKGSTFYFEIKKYQA